MALGGLLLCLACDPEPAAAPTPEPTPAASPERTAAATPTPPPTADDLIARAAARLAVMQSARFDMIDELETGALFFGTTFRSMEAEVQSPDSVRMLVSVVAPALGFVEIEIVAAGDQAFMKFSEDAPWAPLPADQMPFNFAGVGVTLSEILPRMAETTIVGDEDVNGTSAVRVEGTITSDDLIRLITSANTGHPITLSLWLDESDQTLRRMRILGRLYDDDAPETSRLLTFTIDAPVDIRLPDVASGQ